jgi:hypothetical protein
VGSVWKVVPGWTWVLLFFGFLPFLVIRFCAGERVEGRIPVTAHAFKRQRYASRAALASLVLGPVAVVWGIADGRFGIAWFGLVCVIGAAVGALLSEHWWVGLLPARRRSNIVMTRVHRNFALAVDDMYHAPSRDVGGVAHLA